MTDIEYILIDESIDEQYTFESEEELEDFLTDQEYTEEDLEEVRVFRVSREYRVNVDREFELEEV